MPKDNRKHETEKLSPESTASGFPPPPPDGGWGWVVVFSSFMIHFIADGVTYTFGIFFVEFLKHFQESKGITSLVSSILVGTTFCIGPVASGLTSTYGCRAVTIAGGLVATAGLASSVLAPNVTVLIITAGFVTGAGFGLMYLPAIVSVTCYFEKKRAFATGVAVCGSGCGTFALAPFIQLLIDVYGWKGALLLTAGLVLNCCVCGALLRPLENSEPPPSRKKKASQEFVSREINGNALHSDSFGKDTLHHCSASAQLTTTNELEATKVKRKTSEDKKQLVLNLQNGFLHDGDLSLPPGSNRRPRSAFLVPSRNGPKSEEEDERTSLSCLQLASSPPSPTTVMPSPSLLLRKDIFYSGSMQNLPVEYRSSNGTLSKKCSMSASSLKASKSIQMTVPDKEKPSCFRRLCCSEEMQTAFREMMNVSLLRSAVFLLFAFSNFFTSIGFNVPYVYTKDRAMEAYSIDEHSASFLLSVIGISNTVGRVLLGYLSDKTWVNRLWLYNVSLTLCGVATAFSSLCTTHALMAIYCAIYGATSGAFVSLTSVILVDLLGLDKLTNAFGLLLMFEGIASFGGPPLTGALYDVTLSYDPGFFVSGAMIALGGVMLFVIPCVQKAEQKRQNPAIELQPANGTTPPEVIV